MIYLTTCSVLYENTILLFLHSMTIIFTPGIKTPRAKSRKVQSTVHTQALWFSYPSEQGGREGREDATPQSFSGQWTLLKPNYKLPPPQIFSPSCTPDSVGTAVEHDKSTSFPSTFILVLYKIDRRKIVTVTFWYKTQWVWKKILAKLLENE